MEATPTTVIKHIERVDHLTINITIPLPPEVESKITYPTPTIKKRGPRCGNNDKREWLYGAILAGVIKVNKKGDVYRKKDGVWVKVKQSQQGKAIRDKQGKVVGHKGYKVYRLTWAGRQETVYVHETVYMYYNGLIPYDMTVDHINNCKADNRIKNLQLLTLEENARKSNK